MYQIHSTMVSPDRFLSVTVTRAPLEKVRDAICTVLSRISPDRFRGHSKKLDVADIYGDVPPAGGAHLFEVVAYSPRLYPGNCAFITNISDGWNSLSHLVAREHKELQVQVISTQDGVEFPKNRIEVWRGGESKRLVMVMRDSDKWVFFQKGVPEIIEDMELYKIKIRRKRLERSTVLSYMARFGWGIESPEFWDSKEDALYFSETRKV